jgi:hypothetical protein
MPRKTILKFKKANRTTRKLKGGSCDPSHRYRDYNECISVGCDKSTCRKYQQQLADRVSEMVDSANKHALIARANELLNQSTQSIQMMQKQSIMNHDDQSWFNEWVDSHRGRVNHMHMNESELAKLVEEYRYSGLTPDVKRTVTRRMRQSETTRLKSLIPVLLKGMHSSH